MDCHSAWLQQPQLLALVSVEAGPHTQLQQQQMAKSKIPSFLHLFCPL